MENDRILEKTREAIEEHIQRIVHKGGNMTPPDIEILTKDICALEALKRIENINEGYSENSYDSSGNSYRRGRSRNTGRFLNRDEMSYHDGGGSSEAYHDGNGNSSRYYDGGSGNSGYSGHSIQDRMIAQLERMIDSAQSDNERKTVHDWINRLRN